MRATGAGAVLVSQWTTGSRRVPAERCPAIEQATGGLVTCEDLRPDVPWSVLRATSSGASIAPQATESVAVAGEVIAVDPTGALRTDTVRRHATRRAKDVSIDEDRRHSGPPFQCPEVGVA